VLYGSSAINGVINIRSAYPTSTPKTTISYSLGDYSDPMQPAQNWYNGAIPGFMNLNFLHSEIINKNLDFVIGGNFNLDQGYIGPAPAQGYLPPDLKKSLLLTDSIPTFSNQDMLKERARLNFSLRYRSKKITGLSYGINGNGMYNKTNMVLAWLNDSSGLYRGYPGAVFLENQTFFNLDPFIKYDAGNGATHSLVTRVFHTDDEITNNQSTNGTLYYAEYQLQKKYQDLGLTFTGALWGVSPPHTPSCMIPAAHPITKSLTLQNMCSSTRNFGTYSISPEGCATNISRPTASRLPRIHIQGWRQFTGAKRHLGAGFLR